MTHYAEIGKHLEDARDLYNEQVANTTASFHTHELSLDEFSEIVVLAGDIYESYAVLSENEFAGYVLFCPFNPRQAYRRTAEVTIYIKKEFRGSGIASNALAFIENRARRKDVKNLIAKITAENTRSIKFFQKAGYISAGLLKDVGEKFGRILSVAIYQKEI